MNILADVVAQHVADGLARLPQPQPGVVFSVDPDTHSVRVTLQPSGSVTGWIPDLTVAAGSGLQIACPSEVGTHVLLVPTEADGDSLRVVGRLYDQETPPPTSPFNGGKANPGECLIVSGKAAFHLTPSGVSIGFGGVRLVVDSQGVHVTGTLDASTDVLAAGISGKNHKHGGVQAGSSLTAVPQ